jgi:hypothetical protein
LEQFVNQIRSVFFFSLFLASCNCSAAFFADEYQLACIDRVKANSNYDLLKVNFRSDAPIFIRYSNQKKVTDEERELIPKYMEALENCRTMTKDLTEQNTDPIQANIATDMFNVFVGLVVRLYNRELTYGEYFKMLDKEQSGRGLLLNQRQAELAGYEEQNQQEETAALEGYRRQLLQQSFQQLQHAFTPAQRPASVPLPRVLTPPTKTICKAVLDTVQCTTQ